MKYGIKSSLGYWTGCGWSDQRSAIQWLNSEADQLAKAERMRIDGVSYAFAFAKGKEDKS